MNTYLHMLIHTYDAGHLKWRWRVYIWCMCVIYINDIYECTYMIYMHDACIFWLSKSKWHMHIWLSTCVIYIYDIYVCTYMIYMYDACIFWQTTYSTFRRSSFTTYPKWCRYAAYMYDVYVCTYVEFTYEKRRCALHAVALVSLRIINDVCIWHTCIMYTDVHVLIYTHLIKGNELYISALWCHYVWCMMYIYITNRYDVYVCTCANVYTYDKRRCALHSGTLVSRQVILDVHIHDIHIWCIRVYMYWYIYIHMMTDDVLYIPALWFHNI